MRHKTREKIDFARIRLAIVEQLVIPAGNIHGRGHWARVEQIGLRLAADTDADLDVVRLFALFHDARRENDGADPGHGRRGAELAASWRGRLFALDAKRFDRLYEACARHTDGDRSGDPTIGTCWDADRLDLARLGIEARPDLLSTATARDPKLIDWAWSLSNAPRPRRDRKRRRRSRRR